MLQKINEPVSVSSIHNYKTKSVVPKSLIWRGRIHHLLKLGLHHKYRNGRTLYHVFSVSSSSLYFRLVLDTENLQWRLEEISDGLPE